jgi:hypothetical protein
MTPYYTLALDICIRGLRESDDVWMRCVKLVPFIPVNGVALELWHDDSEAEEEGTHKITLENVHYSFQHSMFIEEQADDDLVLLLREGNNVNETREELIKFYSLFGFTRFNFPTVQVVK